jgi:hypothetical protein
LGIAISIVAYAVRGQERLMIILMAIWDRLKIDFAVIDESATIII